MVIEKPKIKDYFEMLRFQESLFALPFAYAAALLAGNGRITLWNFFWITLAFFSGRTIGMSLNRLIDKNLDALNPRTAARALVTGVIKSKSVWILTGISLVVFIVSCLCLKPICFYLSPLALFILWGHTYLKRFTWLCSAGVGLVLAMAPVGGWLAAAGSIGVIPLLLGAAVLFWVAGFDILHRSKDYHFYKQVGLYSIPRKFGLHKALWISVFSHVAAIIFLALTGIAAHLGWFYGIGLMIISLLLIYEHALVSPEDFSRFDQTMFFKINAAISILVFVSTWAGFWTWHLIL
jgi:4-hydroxybenzoate polyprenyltransferase